MKLNTWPVLLLGFFSPTTLACPAAGSKIDPAGTETVLRAEDPKAWRDQSKPALRAYWDTLEGKPAPELSGLSEWLGTDARSLADLRGKVVLIDMWATWCRPCRAGFPHLKQLHKRHTDEGLVILGIHSKRGWETMESVVEDEELPWAFAADKDSKVGSLLGVQYIPTYFAVDRKGTMRIAGADRGKLDAIVEALLAEPAPTGAGSDKEPETAVALGADGWPKIVKKEVYAKDYRGKPAPAFHVGEWLDDEPEREGKVLLIDFWATWCKPCVGLIPETNHLAEMFKDDLVIVGLSDESADKIRAFRKKIEMKYPLAVDEDSKMSSELEVAGIPHVLLVSSDGIVRWQGLPSLPADPLTEDLVRAVIEKDPGVRARREKEKQAGKDADGRD